MGHPLGVLPDLGDQTSNVRAKGLGLFDQLTDEMLVSNILSLLDARELTRLSTVSRALYCFCNHDELWKGLCLENVKDWTYTKSWQETYLRASVPNYTPNSKILHDLGNGFQSDMLYQSWLCGCLEIDPSWLEIENIDRRAGLTVEEFIQQYEKPNRPVILTDQVINWPAMEKWTRPYFKKELEGKTVLVGDAPMSYERYCAYADGQSDENPLYLFDKHFAESSPTLATDYTTPPHFSHSDLFSLLPPNHHRPDYRWLIIGPYRSGSTFHQDPNQTCAWNAVVKGSKKWVMYPPSVTPPGVQASGDGVDVTAPVSIIEWFLKFYGVRDAVEVAPMECTVKAGEVLFVPRGWWHTALNLDHNGDTVAVTQNYVSGSNVGNVLRFLRTRNPELVSGLDKEEDRVGLYDTFVAVLKEKRPDTWAEYEREEAEKLKRAEESAKLSSLFKPTTETAPTNPNKQQQHTANGTTAKTNGKPKERHSPANANGVDNEPPPSFAFKFSF